MINLIVMVVAFMLTVVAVLVGLMLWILCKAAKDTFAEEDPCDTCLRWSECNGVDEECPRRKRDGK